MITRRKFLIQSVMFGLSLIDPIKTFASGAWPILNEWNFKEFEKYSEWVHNIYYWKRNGKIKHKGAALDEIVKDADMNLLNDPSFLGNGNSQLQEHEIKLLKQLTHCGDFPMLLFSYYSYRRGLPAIVSKIKMLRGGDIRYSFGNHPIGHIDSVSCIGDFSDFLIDAITSEGGGYNFVSGNFRTEPNLEETDSVPIVLDRRFLRPGSICYNANGHVLVVGDISESGEVHFLDAHPDHSITYNQTLSAIPFIKAAEYGPNGFKRCYDGFRNIRLAKVDGGKARSFTNEEMIEFGYSVEQYKLMAKLKEVDEIVIKGQRIKDYPQLVKACLRTKKEKPLIFLEDSVKELTEMFWEREKFVQAAWKDVLENGLITLPNESNEENIYQANGRWEIWSSPSSDVDRRGKYFYILTTLEDMIVSFGNNEAYDYSDFSSQIELVKTLMERKKEFFEENFILYKNSVGENVRLSLKDIEQRLFDLSFDPNHCPELRWGAPPGSDERKTIKLFKTPLRTGEILDALKAYELEQGLRYYPIRQSTPTSLNPEKNPKKSQFELIDIMFQKFLK